MRVYRPPLTSKNGFSNGVFNDPKKVGSGYKLINVKDMYQGNTISLENLTLLDITQKEFEKNRVSWGDVFFTRSSLVKEGIAHSSVFLSDDEHTTYDGHLIRMSPNRDSISPQYLGYALKTDSSRRQLVARGKTTTMTTIGQEDISSVVMVIGKREEQQRIASFLSVSDTKIEQLGKKKSLLKEYKKGMMQKLFNQEIRFKNEQGNDFPDWEKVKIGDICNIRRGASPRPITSSKWFDENSRIGWVRISDVTKSNKYLRKTTQYLSDAGIQKSRLIPKGNMIMSICATIGKPIYTDFDVCIHDGFVVFDGLSAEKEFLFYLLELIQKRWYRYGQPGTQVNLNSGIVSNESISLPSNPEQIKIANFLSAIDQKIELVGTELELAKSFKKGLLQQMFI